MNETPNSSIRYAKMDVYVHFLLFFDILVLFLQSYSIVIISGRLLRHYFFCLTPCLVCLGVLYRFRLCKPANSRVRRILGNEWGAYQHFVTDNNRNEDGFEVKVVGHRGCGLDAPENSISALNRMFLNKIRMVEFDVLLTKDHVPIVFHDFNLSRVTGVNRAVSDMTLEEIKKLDISVKHPFGDKFRNEAIPTLKSFVSVCISKNIRMVIDLKIRSAEMIKIINDLFKEFPELYNLALVSSFDPFLIYQIRKNDPKIVSSLCWRPFYHSHEEFCGIQGPSVPRSRNPLIRIYQRALDILHYWFLFNIGYYFIGISVILLAKDMVTREIIRYWGKRGVRVIAWSVNLPSEKQFFENSLQITYMTDTVISN